MFPSLLLMVASLAGPSSAGSASQFSGTARAAPAGPVLYREDHYVYGPPGERRGLVLYRCPDGKPFARKTTRDAGAEDPDFALVDAQNGYREGVRTSDGMRRVYVHRVGARHTRTGPLPKVATPVIDSGFNAFVMAHWNELLAGRRLKMEFLVPSRMKYIQFRVQRHRDAAAAARGNVVLRLQLDRWFAFALPHIDVGYDRATRELRRFRGLSNLRDRDGKNVKVVLHYPAGERRATVPMVQVRAALDAPLDGRCRLD